MTTTRKVLLAATGLTSWLLLAGMVSAEASEGSCQEHHELLNQAIQGDPAGLVAQMLKAQPDAQQLAAGFNPRVIRGALGDRLRPDKTRCAFGGKKKDQELVDCAWTNSDATSTLEADIARGRISYVNSERGRWSEQANDLTPEAAIAALSQAATRLGVPASELGVLDARNVMAAHASPEGGPAEVRRAWVAASASRQLGGFHVLGSAVYAAIDAKGQVARMQVDWPEMRLDARLSALDALTREELVDRAAQELGEEIPCDQLGEVIVTPVFAPVDFFPAAGPDDDDNEQSADATKRPSRSPAYAPAMLVTALSTPVEDGSGKFASPAREYVVPVLGPIGG